MSLKILYFAWAREMVGIESEDAPAAANPAALADQLASRSSGHAALFADREPLKLLCRNPCSAWPVI